MTDYESVGIFPELGWKAGVWQDVGWWQLRLATME
jgi:L-amino acid N-acyltransferase YncA